MKTAFRNDIVRFLDRILELDQWPDAPYNNGLQFAGDAEVAKAVCAVDASAELFCKAADLDAGFIFVHHGISWGSGIRRIDGLLAERIKLLAANGISLYAAHLPLDANPRFGHNARLADMIGLTERRTFFAARTKLEKAGFMNPDAALFRMTANEIRTLARTPDDQIDNYLENKSNTELRWQILIHRFQHPTTETPNENSFPE